MAAIEIRDARAVGEHFDASLSTHDHRDAHDRDPVVVPHCRNAGHAGCGAVARLCLTLLRMTPRLHVLILISPFKFLWHEQRAARRPTFHPAVQELCSALAPASGARNDPPPRSRRHPAARRHGEIAEKTLLLPARIVDPREIDAAQMVDSNELLL